jgi:hypothetical protein
MHSIILLKLVGLLGLAHQDDDRPNSTKQRVAGASVSLPGRNEVRQAILEDLLVDFDLIRHIGSVILTAAFRIVGMKNGEQEVRMQGIRQRMDR